MIAKVAFSEGRQVPLMAARGPGKSTYRAERGCKPARRVFEFSSSAEEPGVNFVAIDFETANASLGSICQVGMVSFKDGEVVETFSSLIDPDCYFDAINVSIHKIDALAVRGAPLFPGVYPEIFRRTENVVVVCHTSFDRVALKQASQHHGLSCPSCHWLDTTRVVRRAWPKYRQSGYGLANLTRDLGISFEHHDAVEDARATGMILVRALKDSGLTLDDWLVKANARMATETVKREGNTDGDLASEVIVFTGALSMSRSVAANLAATAGCEVDAGVTKRTTLLIVGDQDVRQLAPGHSKSAKHLKAEELIAKGQTIRILCETDFRQMALA